VFSPYYALAQRRNGAADPESHVALNVAIYGADGYRWTMTERSRRALQRDATTLTIGPSRLAWTAEGSMVVDFDEVAVPLPRRVRGHVEIRPHVHGQATFQLDPAGRHLWQPVAPRATAAVTLESPMRTWTGSAYVDHNRGFEPLAIAFRSWDWSRTIEPQRTRIFYDVVLRDGSLRSLHLDDAQSATQQSIEPVAERVALQPSLWRLQRAARTDAGTRPRIVESWEDGPFYARALIEQRLDNQPVRAVHEALSLDRFARATVQAMLPFRMPRMR
jgi:carotenoid 1,2-hydratase